jgi:hypothetical protein
MDRDTFTALHITVHAVTIVAPTIAAGDFEEARNFLPGFFLTSGKAKSGTVQ